jgi:hypothetical protein
MMKRKKEKRLQFFSLSHSLLFMIQSKIFFFCEKRKNRSEIHFIYIYILINKLNFILRGKNYCK